MTLFELLKWIHVLAAIAAVGSNLTYGFWLARAGGEPAMLPFALRGVKRIDDRLANPAYGLLLVTGLLMIAIGPLPWTMPWLLTSLGLYAVLVAVGLLGYTPTLRRQIRVFETSGADSPVFGKLSRRAVRLGITLGILAVGIVFLMVVKPDLWG